MTMRFLFVVVLVLGAASLHAQQPAAPAPATPAQGGAAPPAEPVDPAPAPPPNYVYVPGGRRDPFVRPVVRDFVASTTSATSRPPGVAGLMVAEIVVRGLLQSEGAWIAMIGGPDGRTYTVRSGDRLLDGTVRTITSEAVVILQQINDPLSVAKQREVRKFLRGGEQVQ
jgi:Tfp pilus assembly protein PilP